jgi:hypothetical protein
MNDPRLLTAEQLADIEVCRGADYPVDYLLAHIDAQAEQLRRAKAREAAYEAVLWMAERYAEGDRNDADTLAGWMRQVEANR